MEVVGEEILWCFFYLLCCFLLGFVIDLNFIKGECLKELVGWFYRDLVVCGIE